MPNKDKKHADNTIGTFYVDQECVDCDLCRQTAPQNFNRNAQAGHSFVAKQPENEKEIQDCLRAIHDCPVEAIGSDGV